MGLCRILLQRWAKMTTVIKVLVFLILVFKWQIGQWGLAEGQLIMQFWKTWKKSLRNFWLLSLPSVTGKTLEHNPFNHLWVNKGQKGNFKQWTQSPLPRALCSDQGDWAATEQLGLEGTPGDHQAQHPSMKQIAWDQVQTGFQVFRDGYSLSDNFFQCLSILKVKVFTHV